MTWIQALFRNDFDIFSLEDVPGPQINQLNEQNLFHVINRFTRTLTYKKCLNQNQDNFKQFSGLILTISKFIALKL